MRLSAALTKQTLEQLHGEPEFEKAVVVPDDNPAKAQLTNLFGDHTFFLDSAGLHIIEPSEPLASNAPAGRVIKIAGWTDADYTALSPHHPEATDLIVRFDSGDGKDRGISGEEE